MAPTAQTCRSTVGDLDAITPASYLEFGETVVHDLSYQQARHFNLPVQGVYVANPGYSLATAGVPRGALITEFNNQPVPDTKAFAGQLAMLGDGDRATVRYVTLDEPANPVAALHAHGPPLVPGEQLPPRRHHRPVALRRRCRPALPRARSPAAARNCPWCATSWWQRWRHHWCSSTFDMPFSRGRRQRTATTTAPA